MWKTRIILLPILFSLWVLNFSLVIAAEPAEYGDVVDVNYSLWLDEAHTMPKAGNINKNLRYIYLRRTQTEPIPTEVTQAFPPDTYEQLQQVYLQKFIDAIIGMEVNEIKDFMIAAEDAYGDEDLYYRIKLLILRYDATSGEEVTEENDTTDPFKDFYPLLISGSVIVAGVGIGIWYVHSSRVQRSALSEEKTSSVARAKLIQKDKDKIKELRELTESFTDPKDTVTKEEVKFRPRRR